MGSENIGLVLEGGGLRGVYTSGVIRFFDDKGVTFPYVIGVSMGACNGANYVSRQPERNRIVNIEYVNDSRYISYRNLITKGELFGMDFIFNTIPFSLVPFDQETFFKNKIKFIIGVTDCETGEAVYFEKGEVGEDIMDIFRATCSLPFISRPIHFNGRVLMDGGLADSIPLEKSIEDGNKRNVLVLTRPKGYRKRPSLLNRLICLLYPQYKGLRSALINRHLKYNTTMDLVDRLEEKGDVFVIQPEAEIDAGRIERNKVKLHAAYELGYNDAASSYERLKNFLSVEAGTI
jgi:predicted patatin/cPLA2 family phospholipase